MSIKRVELHGHSTYSMLDGYGTPEQIAARAVELGWHACAQTDHGNCYGHVPWQKACRDAGIKPIFGCEFYIVEDSTVRSKYNESLGNESFPHITVLAKTQQGYRNFLKLMEEAWRRFYYKPRIDRELLFRYQEGLIVLTGCPTGWPSRMIDNGDIDGAYEWIKAVRDNCETSFVELVMQPGYGPSEKSAWHLFDIADKLGMRVVGTGDSHFPRADDHQVQDLMLHINFKIPVGQPKGVTLPSYQYYCSGDELLDRGMRMFAGGEEKYGYPAFDHSRTKAAIELSCEIADMCDVQITKAKSVMFPGLDRPASDVLWDLILKGLDDRISHGQIAEENRQVYLDRAKHEFDVITRKGFEHYMLAVADICNWVRSQNSLVMCRGSAGGCVILFLVGASQTDSIEHDLSFERFYDDTRPDPPDVDMDFETSMRQKVIDRIFEQYGKEYCSQVLALSLIRAKVAVVDTAQVYCIPRSEYEALSMTLDSKDDDFDGQIEELTDPEVIEVLNKHPRLRIAARLMGQVRQSTIHAAGVIVSSEPLHESIAVIEPPGKPPVSSVDKHGAAALGFLKFDLLSVSAYDVTANAARMVGLTMQDLYNLKFDDPEVYKLAKEGGVVGVFQLDGAALKVGAEIGLDTFADSYAASALCRPGAMQFVGLYKDNKENPERFEAYLSHMDPRAAAIVRPTYGVVLYQEQMMAMARQLAGMDWPTVHKLRKRVAAASFNGHTLGAEFGDPFINGCVENGIRKEEAEHWWEAIKQHGIYSFNKSHCVTYAYVSYWMLWLKRYHPDAYYAAYLAQEGVNGKNNWLMKRLIAEWRTRGGKIQMISKARPTVSFSLSQPGVICGGWMNLNGVGESTAKIVAANGPYKTWAELSHVLPPSVYGQLVETGMTGEMTNNTARLLHLAPWFPVRETQQVIKDAVDPFRKPYGIHAPGQLPWGQRAFDINVAGYVSTRYKKPRTGSFKGDQIIYTLEDETGTIVARVSTKRKEMQVKVKDAWEIGDYVVANGFWTGDGTLFVANFVPIRKWNALT